MVGVVREFSDYQNGVVGQKSLAAPALKESPLVLVPVNLSHTQLLYVGPLYDGRGEQGPCFNCWIEACVPDHLWQTVSSWLFVANPCD